MPLARSTPRPDVIAALLCGALLIVPGAVHAAGFPDESDRALPCRPTIACTADLVPTGAFEIESGYIYRRSSSGGEQRSFPFLLKLTIAPWVQVQAGSNGYTAASGSAPARYFDDAILGAKFHLTDQGRVMPSIAVSGAVSLPTLSGQEGYLRTYDALFIAYATKDLGPVHVDLNGGANVWRVEHDALPQGFVALALSGDLAGPFGVMAEGYYFSDAAPVAPQDGGFLFAITVSPRKWWMFDLGGDVGFFPRTRAWSAFVGMTIIPAVLW